MQKVILSLLLLYSTVFRIAHAEDAVNEAVSLPYPAMIGLLVANPKPLMIDAGSMGDIYIDGVISGVGLFQNNPEQSLGDLSNAQLFIQKKEGLIQFYLQGGGYSLPSLGTSYLRMQSTTDDFYGLIPVGFVEVVPNNNFSIMAGKLPTLLGAEDTFTFQNANIERGLLWNQTNAVNRGVQTNITEGPVLISLALSDGFYSGTFDWLSSALTYTLNDTNSLTVVASGNIKRDSQSSLVTPLAQNNSQVYDLIYSYTVGHLTLSPNLQYTHVPQDTNIGLMSSASTYGTALIAKYTFNSQWSFAGRLEYIDTSGGTNVAYGPGSNAWSLTITPTYQYKIFFIRAEASMVKADNITEGSGFGASGTDTSQIRMLIETGILF